MTKHSLHIPKAYSFLLGIYKKIIDNKPLTIQEIRMLSSRFSGKSYNVMNIFFILLLAQQKVPVFLQYIRSRSTDCENEFREFVGRLEKLFGSSRFTYSIKAGFIQFGKNKIQFISLNEEKQQVAKNGGKIGAPIRFGFKYIITFFEEVSQLNKDLVENYDQSVRGDGNDKVQKLSIYASNPWVKTHWFIENFIKVLPENEFHLKQLLNQGYNIAFVEKTKTLYYRPRWTTNKHNLTNEEIKKIEELKNLNYNKWRIVSLGLSGSLNSSIYQASLEKANQNVETHMIHEYYGGVDWGDGKSSEGSSTFATIIGVSPNKGIDVYGEYEWWNNKGIVLGTQQILSRVADFYIDFYKGLVYKKPIQIRVDNAALGDFFHIFQKIINDKGYAGIIQVAPAFKPKNTWERVETTNALLSMGILRISEKITPLLYDYLNNCYEVVKPNPMEGTKRERSHQFTHGIHAMEYAIGEWFKEFQQYIPLLENKSNGKYAII